jgi:two-component system sensor histidine kinase KdpD
MTDIGRLVGQVASGYPADGRPIEVRAEAIVAEVDAPKVERIVENLLANALKHTPPDTEICIRVEGRDEAVLIAVDDRGPGVVANQREAIFELFNRGETSSKVTGAGIGLSLVAQFAAAHDGRVWVEENAGGGASFHVLLPMRRSD